MFFLDRTFNSMHIFIIMEKKVCSTCNEEKPLTDYYLRNSRNNKPYDRCKKCFSNYCSERGIERKIQSIKYKGSSCVDCGIKFPDEPYVIFDFHHTDPNQKEFVWAQLKLKSDEKIKKELDKCELLCSNCHRKRHHKMVTPSGFEPET